MHNSRRKIWIAYLRDANRCKQSQTQSRELQDLSLIPVQKVAWSSSTTMQTPITAYSINAPRRSRLTCLSTLVPNAQHQASCPVDSCNTNKLPLQLLQIILSSRSRSSLRISYKLVVACSATPPAATVLSSHSHNSRWLMMTIWRRRWTRETSTK